MYQGRYETKKIVKKYEFIFWIRLCKYCTRVNISHIFKPHALRCHIFYITYFILQVNADEADLILIDTTTY